MPEQKVKAATTNLVLEERQEHVAIWKLNRPDMRNALSKALLEELLLLTQTYAEHDWVRALVIAGNEQAFSAGADLKERRGMSSEQILDFLEIFRATLRNLEAFRVPVIAAIDGVALGGGLELALACDFRVASQLARVGLPEVKLGILPGAGGTQRLTRLVGPSAAKYLILLGKQLSGEEAKQAGIVHECTTDKTALSRALELAHELATGAPIAISAAMEAIDGAMDPESRTFEEGLALERACYLKTLHSKDRLEALEAFAEKRPPVFIGN